METDDRSEYEQRHCSIVNGELFQVGQRYTMLDYLGSGAYGVVCAAYDKTARVQVAIKKCKNIFSSKTIAKRTLRELRILKCLDHDNIIKLFTLLQIPQLSTDDFNQIYAVFEIMETDLASVIKSKQVLLDTHVQIFMFQIVNALQYLHESDIVHRDLKPRY